MKRVKWAFSLAERLDIRGWRPQRYYGDVIGVRQLGLTRGKLYVISYGGQCHN